MKVYTFDSNYLNIEFLEDSDHLVHTFINIVKCAYHSLFDIDENERWRMKNEEF